MKETLEIINRMQADGVIDGYAIGGAVGATFYLEPAATLDIDVFVSFRKGKEGKLISLTQLYDYLKARGYKTQGEYVVLGGWPVQFLPPGDALGEEALAEAVATEVDNVATRVMTAEHLVALALQLGRAKDHARILQFIESGSLSIPKLESILLRHGMQEKWRRFQSRFLEDKP